MSPQKRSRNIAILIISAFILLILAAVGIWALFFRTPAATMENVSVDANIQPTNSPTPFPEATMFPTSAPLPTATPLASATPDATPSPPIVVEVMGPELVPVGLPVPVEWRIHVISGVGEVNVSLDDLGGTMLVEEGGGKTMVQNVLATTDGSSVSTIYDREWIISGIIDPNVGRGVVSFLLEAPNAAEIVSMPWAASDVVEVEIQSVTAALDELLVDISAPVDVVEVAAPNTLSYEGPTGLRFVYPATWFVNEFQDGVVQISPENMGAADTASVPTTSYAAILSGERAELGIPDEVGPSAQAILDWLLGDLTAVGQDGAIQFVSEQLRVVDQFDMTLDNGEVAAAALLRSEATEQAELFDQLLIITARGTKVTFFTAFVPDGRSEMEAFENLALSVDTD